MVIPGQLVIRYEFLHISHLCAIIYYFRLKCPFISFSSISYKWLLTMHNNFAANFPLNTTRHNICLYKITTCA